MKKLSYGCQVNNKQFKTRHKTYRLSNIDRLYVRYSFLFLMPLALLTLFFIYKFYPYLYDHEVRYGIVLSVISIIISISFGSLIVSTRTVEDKALIGFIPSLRKVRAEIDNSMDFENDETEVLGYLPNE